MYSAFVLPFVLALALGMAAPGALADGFPTTLREAITVRVAEATMSFTRQR